MPPRWSWDEPWAWVLPTLAGEGEGKVDEAAKALWERPVWGLNDIPLGAPPVELRA